MSNIAPVAVSIIAIILSVISISFSIASSNKRDAYKSACEAIGNNMVINGECVSVNRIEVKK